MQSWLQVFLGGIVGATIRFVIQTMSNTLTMLWIVNLIGSFLLGCLNGYYERKESKYKLFFTTGLLGAFTTFSTFSEASIDLLKENNVSGLFFIFGMTSACIVAAYLGYLMNRGKK